MTDYADTLRRHARLAILRFLEDAPNYTSNVSMLAGELPRIGIGFTRDQVAGECAWLQEQGLVTLTEPMGFTVVAATLRGIEIAQGIARHPEIEKPKPRGR